MAPDFSQTEVLDMSKRKRMALLGALFLLPLLGLIVLITFAQIAGPPSIGALVIPVQILGWVGGVLLLIAWITPRGHDPFHRERPA